MASTYRPLWIDPFEGRLYAGWQNNQTAPTLVFKQGDEVDIELFLIKKGVNSGQQESVPFPTGSTIRFAIGRLDAAPTAGTYNLSYGGDTAEIAYDEEIADIETLLNALPSITAEGGVDVESISTTSYRITFRSVGVRTGFNADPSALSPTSSAAVSTLRAGTASVKAIYTVKVYQSVAVFQDTWVDSDEPTITVETLEANKAKRVTIVPTPLSGSWTLTATENIKNKVDEAGDEDDVPTYWTETVTQRLSIFNPNFDWPATTSNPFKVGRSIWQLDVQQVAETAWDFTVKNDYEVPVGYTMPFTASGNFIKFPSKISTVSFNTVEIEYLLNGANTRAAVLEIEVQSPSGERWTILQTACTILNDLIDQSAYTPTQYDEPLNDAPADGSLYARRNNAWEAFLPEDNLGIPEAPVDGTPYLRKDAAWSSDIDGGTY